MANVGVCTSSGVNCRKMVSHLPRRSCRVTSIQSQSVRFSRRSWVAIFRIAFDRTRHKQTDFLRGHCQRLSHEGAFNSTRSGGCDYGFKSIKRRFVLPKRAQPRGAEHLLRAAQIHLANDGATTFLVAGSRELSGADNGWLCIVRVRKSRASIILEVGTNCITVKKHRTHGYKDIEASWASAGETLDEGFAYGGEKYQLVSSSRKARTP